MGDGSPLPLSRFVWIPLSTKMGYCFWHIGAQKVNLFIQQIEVFVPETVVGVEDLSREDEDIVSTPRTVTSNR